MIRTRTRRWAVGLVASCLVVSASWALSASPAWALEAGEAAPAFEGKEFFNTEPVSLKEMRGRLILYELFSTT